MRTILCPPTHFTSTLTNPNPLQRDYSYLCRKHPQRTLNGRRLMRQVLEVLAFFGAVAAYVGALALVA